MRSKEVNQQLDEELFHKLTGGWQWTRTRAECLARRVLEHYWRKLAQILSRWLHPSEYVNHWAARPEVRLVQQKDLIKPPYITSLLPPVRTVRTTFDESTRQRLSQPVTSARCGRRKASRRKARWEKLFVHEQLSWCLPHLMNSYLLLSVTIFCNSWFFAANMKPLKEDFVVHNPCPKYRSWLIAAVL